MKRSSIILLVVVGVAGLLIGLAIGAFGISRLTRPVIMARLATDELPSEVDVTLNPRLPMPYHMSGWRVNGMPNHMAWFYGIWPAPRLSGLWAILSVIGAVTGIAALIVALRRPRPMAPPPEVPPPGV